MIYLTQPALTTPKDEGFLRFTFSTVTLAEMKNIDIDQMILRRIKDAGFPVIGSLLLELDKKADGYLICYEVCTPAEIIYEWRPSCTKPQR